MISFTGSTAVGCHIQATAAKRMQRTLLELGGKSPNIIFADADRQKALASATSVCRSTPARSASPARGC
jgi:acyl-CoA reductase-like NAD-dependent aldehyde dehydrogenase